MADKIFRIPLLNSFVWTAANPVYDSRYDTIPFDDVVDTYNPNGIYFYKWKLVDTAYVQLLSDYVPTLKFYTLCDNQLYKTIPIPAVANSLIGVTFKSYGADVSFADWDEGEYYGEITYTDDNSNVIVWQTAPLSVAENWDKIPGVYPGTILIQYKNSYNAQNVIFKPTGLEFTFRIEGCIKNFLPSSTDDIYTDQKHNLTLENSVPFRIFTMVIGVAGGIPNRAIDKVQRIFSVDQKKFDGKYYEKEAADDKFTPFRPENSPNEDGFWTLQVVQNDNFVDDSYNVGENPTPDDEIQVIRRSKQYVLNGGNIACAGVFKKFTTLIGLQIDNRELDAFNITVGTSLGGTDIGVFTLDGSIANYFDIKKAFDSPQTVYIGGLVGHDTDVTIVYDQLDDRSQIMPLTAGGYETNTVYTYFELVPGEFETHWDISTGLGQTGTQFEGCAMIDGRNGTAFNFANEFEIGFDYTQPATRQTLIGSNSLVLDMTQLPAQGIGMFRDSVNAANGDTPEVADTVARARNNGSNIFNYEISKGDVSTGFVGVTAPLGIGAPIDNRPLARVMVKFCKL